MNWSCDLRANEKPRNIYPQSTLNFLINYSVSDGGDCRTAPASPGLLIIKYQDIYGTNFFTEIRPGLPQQYVYFFCLVYDEIFSLRSKGFKYITLLKLLSLFSDLLGFTNERAIWTIWNLNISPSSNLIFALTFVPWLLVISVSKKYHQKSRCTPRTISQNCLKALAKP